MTSIWSWWQPSAAPFVDEGEAQRNGKERPISQPFP